VHDVLGLEPQRLRAADLGGHDVAGAVAELELAVVLGLLEVHAVVEDLDLLDVLGVVVDEHLLAADDDRAPQLDGAQPAGLDLGDDAAGEAQVDEGHVGDARGDAGAAGDAKRLGRLAEPVVEDAEVVRGEVPDHAHVLLVQAQVHALGGDEVDLAEVAGVDELLDLAHRWAEDEGVADHEREATLGGEVDQLAGLRRVRGHGLLDEDVLAGLEGGPGEGMVRADRREDEHGVDVRVGEDLVVLGGDGHRRVAGLSLLEGLRPGVADPLDLRPRQFAVVAQEVGAPVAVADEGDAEGTVGHRSVPSGDGDDRRDHKGNERGLEERRHVQWPRDPGLGLEEAVVDVRMRRAATPVGSP